MGDTDNLPVLAGQPESDPLEAEDTDRAIAVSGWTGDRAIAIGDESKEEWLIFDGDLLDV